MTRELFKLDSTISWGKHEGQTIKYIIDNEISYIKLLVEDVTWFELDRKSWECYIKKSRDLDKFNRSKNIEKQKRSINYGEGY